MVPNEAERPPKKKPKTRKPVSEAYLERAAAYYLGRYASSAENLKRVLARKVRTRNEGHAMPSAEQLDWIDAVADKFVQLGLVDDAEYARLRTASLHRSGKSERMIRAGLKHKGVSDEHINEAVDNLKQEAGDNLDWEAALAYARKRRFGPHRTKEGDTDKKRKELASFARAGFSFNLARRIVEADSLDDITD